MPTFESEIRNTKLENTKQIRNPKHETKHFSKSLLQVSVSDLVLRISDFGVILQPAQGNHTGMLTAR
ncbi:hypothetical protein G4Y73_07920 [Wenzhouxiangella sp. XN201]|nr:hypothetical protein [Wenzhouxiangella sp. XN201]